MLPWDYIVFLFYSVLSIVADIQWTFQNLHQFNLYANSVCGYHREFSKLKLFHQNHQQLFNNFDQNFFHFLKTFRRIDFFPHKIVSPLKCGIYVAKWVRNKRWSQTWKKFKDDWWRLILFLQMSIFLFFKQSTHKNLKKSSRLRSGKEFCVVEQWWSTFSSLKIYFAAPCHKVCPHLV